MTRYTEEFGPNVSRILCRGELIVRGRIPQQVRKELAAAVKARALGHVAKDGLLPEMFYHPDHKTGAMERRKRAAEYSIGCIAKVIAVKPVEQRISEALASIGTAV